MAAGEGDELVDPLTQGLTVGETDLQPGP